MKIFVLHVSKHAEFCLNARDKVVKEFEAKVVAGKCIKLYEDILNA
ncbi:hypothetical protein [Sulfurospirillum sp. 1612]